MALCACDATSVVKYYSFVSLESSQTFIVDEFNYEWFNNYFLYTRVYRFYLALYNAVITSGVIFHIDE